ncbi:MAG: hypothetical protein HOP29_05280 [Phycisphaerales bacterium]|nr:hypothetical protein [Phycisphaerales bacterium]
MEDTLQSTLIDLAALLDRLGIPYAITGSVVSAVHGDPVTSLNVDVLVQATPAQAGAVADALPAYFYRDREMLQMEAGRFGIANVVDLRSGLKVDISFVPTNGYLDDAMQRSVLARIGSAGPAFRLTSAEDVVLMKLLWRKDSRSQKQWENALSVMRVCGTKLDWRYLFDHAGQLGVADDLIALRDAGGV